MSNRVYTTALRDLMQGEHNMETDNLKAMLITTTNCRFDNEAAVVDNGDGTVGIPATGHGFNSGDAIVISKTDNYNGEYTVDAATTADVLVITATFIAETFDGNERAMLNPFDASHAFIGDVLGQTGVSEIDGLGYNAGFGNTGRQAIPNISAVADHPNVRAELHGDNFSWTELEAGTVCAMLIVKEAISDADSPVFQCIIANNFPIDTIGVEFPINWNAEGFMQLGTGV